LRVSLAVPVLTHDKQSPREAKHDLTPVSKQHPGQAKIKRLPVCWLFCTCLSHPAPKILQSGFKNKSQISSKKK